MIAPYHIHRCGHLAGLGLDVPLSPWEADLLHASSGAAGSSATLTREIVKTGDKHETEIVSEGGGLGLSAAYLLASPPAWDEGECEQYLSQELGEEKELSDREEAMKTAKAQTESAQGGSEHGESGPPEEASSNAMDEYRRRAVVMWAVGEATVNEVVEGCSAEGGGGKEEVNREGDGENISEGGNVGHAWQQRCCCCIRCFDSPHRFSALNSATLTAATAGFHAAPPPTATADGACKPAALSSAVVASAAVSDATAAFCKLMRQTSLCPGPAEPMRDEPLCTNPVVSDATAAFCKLMRETSHCDDPAEATREVLPCADPAAPSLRSKRPREGCAGRAAAPPVPGCTMQRPQSLESGCARQGKRSRVHPAPWPHVGSESALPDDVLLGFSSGEAGYGSGEPGTATYRRLFCPQPHVTGLPAALFFPTHPCFRFACLDLPPTFQWPCVPPPPACPWGESCRDEGWQPPCPRQRCWTGLWSNKGPGREGLNCSQILASW
ncbi:unnamed protein product [Closterium sp. NIES-65]|nr:unnamed protein product [Closterium sp. NIES-65]